MRIGFKRRELLRRYNVPSIQEDAWHTYSGQKTLAFVAKQLPNPASRFAWLMNAGAGVYELRLPGWKEVALDLFTVPILNRRRAVCASVEQLPFQAQTFGAIVCVGEVLAYCDPALAIREFARVLAPSGILICDFGSSRSFRYWLSQSYGRTADLVVDSYNGAPEKIWIYDPEYMKALLISSGFEIAAKYGTHSWSALARWFGAPVSTALSVQKHLEWLKLPSGWADLMTISAVRVAGARG